MARVYFVHVFPDSCVFFPRAGGGIFPAPAQRGGAPQRAQPPTRRGRGTQPPERRAAAREPPPGEPPREAQALAPARAAGGPRRSGRSPAGSPERREGDRTGSPTARRATGGAGRSAARSPPEGGEGEHARARRRGQAGGCRARAAAGARGRGRTPREPPTSGDRAGAARRAATEPAGGAGRLRAYHGCARGRARGDEDGQGEPPTRRRARPPRGAAPETGKPPALRRGRKVCKGVLRTWPPAAAVAHALPRIVLRIGHMC